MLVTVATFTNPLEAHIVRGRLESEGVTAFVAHEHHIWANWFLSVALGGVKLQVAPDDVSRAREILRADRRGEFEDLLVDEHPPPPQPLCPACSSADIRRARSSRNLSLFAAGLASLPLPYTNIRMHCSSCGHSWHDTQARSCTPGDKLLLIALLSGLFILLITGLYYLCRINDINPACW
jgi:hypothetical protein